MSSKILCSVSNCNNKCKETTICNIHEIAGRRIMLWWKTYWCKRHLDMRIDDIDNFSSINIAKLKYYIENPDFLSKNEFLKSIDTMLSILKSINNFLKGGIIDLNQLDNLYSKSRKILMKWADEKLGFYSLEEPLNFNGFCYQKRGDLKNFLINSVSNEESKIRILQDIIDLENEYMY